MTSSASGSKRAAAAAFAPIAADGSAAAAGGAKGFGAAEESLADPACRRGTPEFAAAKAELDKILEKYNDVVAKYEALGVSAATSGQCS